VHKKPAESEKDS